MPVYCVSYDLNRAGRDYSALHDELRRSAGWWHHLGTTWLVCTAEAAGELSARLRRRLDPADPLLVVQIGRDYAGWLPQRAWAWLEQVL